MEERNRVLTGTIKLAFSSDACRIFYELSIYSSAYSRFGKAFRSSYKQLRSGGKKSGKILII